MLKRYCFLIPLILYFLVFGISEEKNSENRNRVEPTRSDPVKIDKTIELKKTIYTNPESVEELKVFKEIEYARKLYESGDHIKAKTILSMLKKDDDKELSEMAHYLCLKWYNHLFIPIEANDDTKYAIDTQGLDNFKKKYPNSEFIEELENVYRNDLATFNTNVHNLLNKNRLNMNVVSSVIYQNDSTYSCSFNRKYICSDNIEHDITIEVSGKINKYEPNGNLLDEYGSTGLLIDDDSTISIKVDNEEKIVLKDYIEHKQQLEYELKKSDEYGSNIRTVREVNVANVTELATYLNNDLIIPRFKVQFIYGKLNQLVPEDDFKSKDIFSDRFNSECVIEFKLDEINKQL